VKNDNIFFKNFIKIKTPHIGIILIQLKILEKYYSNKGTIFIVLTSTKSLFVILKLGITDKGSKLKPI